MGLQPTTFSPSSSSADAQHAVREDAAAMLSSLVSLRTVADLFGRRASGAAGDGTVPPGRVVRDATSHTGAASPPQRPAHPSSGSRMRVSPGARVNVMP